MAKPVIAAVLGLLAAAPASAATFTYYGAPLQGTGSTGFRKIVLQFKIPGPILANQTYTTQSMTAYSDGVNKLPSIDTYLSRGYSYGGQLDSFMWASVTTNGSAQPSAWTFKVEVYFVDGLGNEGYDLWVNGPGNQQSCPTSQCGHDSLYTTLPEWLGIGYNFTSTTFGKLSYKN